MTVEKEFLAYVKRRANINEAIALLYWDLRTGAPKKGVMQRSEVISQLSTDVFNMSVSEEMADYLEKLEAEEQLSRITKRSVEECRKNYDQNKNIPEEEYKEYVKLQTMSEDAWEKAREASDFALFLPFLEKIVAFNKKFVGYWKKDEETNYDVLLDIYEPGMTVKVLDDVFGKLRERIVPLVQEIATRGRKPRTDFLYKHFPKEKQQALGLKMIQQLGYDLEAGRLDTTIHPFATGLNSGDVRITTRYDEEDFQVAILGLIHECGHGIYDQNISPELEGTPLHNGASMGIHESQSLFFEKFIGRNKYFWKQHYQTLIEHSSGQFEDVPLDDFYKAINESEPSLIRIEADELTYPLHIMVRYEIEKELFNGNLQVKDLPTVWNEKMKEYLGITPENDAEGVLQDIHWSDGSFGYFPSYALGYMYAAQFKQRMLVDIPNFDQLLEAGNIAPIKEWLRTHIHQYGMLKKPLEILQDTTGEGLNVNYLIEHLEKKFKDIYEL